MKVKIILAELLKKRGMSRRELAWRINIRHTSINEMCNNETERLPLLTLGKICEELDCEITDVLQLEKEQSD